MRDGGASLRISAASGSASASKLTGAVMDIFPACCADGFADLASFEQSVVAEEATDCEGSCCGERLRRAGLRPTRQRVMLDELLFANGDRHVTAEMLFSEACEAGIPVSLATVYNTLNQFTEAGLLRRIGPDGSRTFFDTNTTVHPHFYVDDEGILIDVPEPGVAFESMPQALPGHELSRVDVIIHLRRKPNSKVKT
jgi:Fur family iron response transcriptional regulator